MLFYLSLLYTKISYIFVLGDEIDIPRLPIDDIMNDPNRDEDTIDPDERRSMRMLDSRIQRDDELSDSEDEGEGDRKDHANHRDPESVTISPSGMRRKLGVGIMGAAPPGAVAATATGTATAGTGSGGPSAHSPVEKLVRRSDAETTGNGEDSQGASNNDEGEAMEVDETPTPPPAAESNDNQNTELTKEGENGKEIPPVQPSAERTNLPPTTS